MRLSTIAKHLAHGPGSPFAQALGAEIRSARERRGLSQATLGEPFGRAFVSRLEHGDLVPSVPALIHLAARLGVQPGELLDRVNSQRVLSYSPSHVGQDDPPR